MRIGHPVSARTLPVPLEQRPENGRPKEGPSWPCAVRLPPSRGALLFLAILALLALVCPAHAAEASAEGATAASTTSLAWWVWPLILLVVTFLLGIVGVLGGIGGGVLFVPIVGGFFPFHMDFVRSAGLLVALTGGLAAGPSLLRSRLADLRLTMPLALVASASAIVGAIIGLALPAQVVQTALGLIILAIVVLMWRSKNSAYPDVPKADALSAALQINGIYCEPTNGEQIEWKVHRTPIGLVLFIFIGMIAGMFGLGAGWANVPVLNLLMGAPLKVSVATSRFMLSIVDTSAAWIYINNGAVIPMIAAPCVIGIMLGASVGVRLLKVTEASVIRKVVLILLIVASVRSLLKGLGIWN